MSLALYEPTMSDADQRNPPQMPDPAVPFARPPREFEPLPYSLYARFVRQTERVGAIGLQHLPPRVSRRLGLAALKLASPFYTAEFRRDDPILAQKLFDLDFKNPIGIAAGADKDAKYMNAFYRRGFGFIEVGTVTPRPQKRNSGKVVFRLDADRAVINRYGFPSDGLDRVLSRIRAWSAPVPFGVNVGANRDSLDRISDYALMVGRVTPYCSYIVINVSSPNTTGLRNLEKGSELGDLMRRIIDVRDELGSDRKPVFLKISPDLRLHDLDQVTDACVNYGIDGLIVSNTTVDRSGLSTNSPKAEGGLSGAPLFEKSTIFVAHASRRLEKRVPIIGVGGIDSGEKAWTKIIAGASLIQIYTSLIFEGPQLIDEIKSFLTSKLRESGFRNISQAVGTEAASIAK